MSAHDEDIIMTGFVTNEVLIDYLRASDVAVFPSRGENASLTIMEAMACEIPVISSDTGNAKKILDEGRGLVLEKYSEEEIAYAKKVIAAFEEAEKAGRAAIQLEGKFIDYPVVEKSRRIVELAQAIGKS